MGNGDADGHGDNRGNDGAARQVGHILYSRWVFRPVSDHLFNLHLRLFPHPHPYNNLPKLITESVGREHWFGRFGPDCLPGSQE